jgi:predicted PolB exonuclease-like 3'-5' exonuclease
MVNSISADIISRRAAKAAPGAPPQTAFLIFDTESVPDGRLLARVKYPRENLTPEEAIARAREEAREQSRDGSDFLPVTFQVPVAVCILRAASDFTLQGLTCLDAPSFRTPQIARQFWRGVGHYMTTYNRLKLVTFNGRGFDMPLMELAAFDHGCCARDYFQMSRNRYNGNHLDLMDWLSNNGACRIAGGLNMMAQRSAGGSPPGCGKLDVAGDQVYEMYKAGRLQEINDYCMFDTLDTYFIFLRTRVVVGELTAEDERALARRARLWLGSRTDELPALRTYLAAWDREHP